MRVKHAKTKHKKLVGTILVAINIVFFFIVLAISTNVPVCGVINYSYLSSIIILGLIPSIVLLVLNYSAFKKAPDLRIGIWVFSLLGLFLVLLFLWPSFNPPNAACPTWFPAYVHVKCTTPQWNCGTFSGFDYANGRFYKFDIGGFGQNISPMLYNITFLVSDSQLNSTIGAFESIQKISIMPKDNNTFELNFAALLNQNNSIVLNESKLNGTNLDFDGSLWASYSYVQNGPVNTSRLSSLTILLRDQNYVDFLFSTFDMIREIIYAIIAVYAIGFGAWALAGLARKSNKALK